MEQGPLRLWPLLALPLGIALGLGAVTIVYAEALSYLSDDPEACANCHVMNAPFDGWLRGPHHAVATCNDCHVPHDFLGKWLAKGINGWHHSRAFTLQDFPDPIRITPRNAAALEGSCRHCHAALVDAIVAVGGGEPEGPRCVHCHRGVGHGPTK